MGRSSKLLIFIFYLNLSLPNLKKAGRGSTNMFYIWDNRDGEGQGRRPAVAAPSLPSLVHGGREREKERGGQEELGR